MAAFLVSLSQAAARMFSAMAEVRCGGVGLVCGQNGDRAVLAHPETLPLVGGAVLYGAVTSFWASAPSSVQQGSRCLLLGMGRIAGQGCGRGERRCRGGLTISMPFFFMRRQDLRYVRMRLRARSWNSGNCRLQDSMMAWIFSLGCLEMGTMRSKFSSTKRRTNICEEDRPWEGGSWLPPPRPPSRAGAHVEGLEALRVHALRVIHLVIVLVVVVVVIVVIGCGCPAHSQVLRAATDLGLDGIIAPRAVGRRLKEGGGQALSRSPTGHGELGD